MGSKADYSPQNVAPLFCFFLPFVNEVLKPKTPITKCQMVFQYEKNPRVDPPGSKDDQTEKDDLFVQHPDCVGIPYTPPPRPIGKSPELRHYEEVAKKSWRLKQYEKKSPAHIKYFQDLPNMEPVQCP